MKKIYYIFAILAFVLTACDKADVNNAIQPTNSYVSVVSENINRPIRPIELGKKKNNPFTVENMQAALDTLRSHPDSLSACMKAQSTLDDIEISTTDLYVRFLPQDSAQYKLLKKDTTLTLFDFPLDYEIKQDGDYYQDPTLTGNYTWLYTRVPVGYQPPADIKYEVLANLFIMENSPYYSEEKMSSVGAMKAKSEFATNRNEALKTIKAIAFFITGNPYGDTKKIQTPSFSPTGLRRVARPVGHKFMWWSWTTTDYYPSGTISVQDYHQMNSSAGVSNYYSLTTVPLKGAKIQLWNWFKWNYAYTKENGYYESDLAYDGDPEHYIYFSGKNGNNTWDLDRALVAICLWVQKYSLGVQSRDEYNAVISSTCDAWDACLTNNAFYEYMTICDKDGITRPSANLRVALRSCSGDHSTPLIQLNKNYLTGESFTALAALTFIIPGSAPATFTAACFVELMLWCSPDIILSGGDIKSYQTDKHNYSEKQSVACYYATVWHELSHASNYQLVRNKTNAVGAGTYWGVLVNVEMFDYLIGAHYGAKGDWCWEQVALCEGWAGFRQFNLGISKFGFTDEYIRDYPFGFKDMYQELQIAGCSITAMEKSLTATTFAGFKQNLQAIYSSDNSKSTNIGSIVDRYYLNPMKIRWKQ